MFQVKKLLSPVPYSHGLPALGLLKIRPKEARFCPGPRPSVLCDMNLTLKIRILPQEAQTGLEWSCVVEGDGDISL